MESFIPLLIFFAFLILLYLTAGCIVELAQKLVLTIIKIPIIIIRSLKFSRSHSYEITNCRLIDGNQHQCLQVNHDIFQSYHFSCPQMLYLTEKELSTNLANCPKQAVTISVSLSGCVYSICLMLNDLNANLMGLIAEISNSCRAEGALVACAYTSCSMGCASTYTTLPLVLDACRLSKRSWQNTLERQERFEESVKQYYQQ